MKMVLTFCGLLLLGLKPGAQNDAWIQGFSGQAAKGDDRHLPAQLLCNFHGRIRETVQEEKIRHSTTFKCNSRTGGREDPGGEIVPRHENPEKSVLLLLSTLYYMSVKDSITLGQYPNFGPKIRFRSKLFFLDTRCPNKFYRNVAKNR